jgi:hypothetical protein
LALFGCRPPQDVDRPSIRQPKTCTRGDIGVVNLKRPPDKTIFGRIARGFDFLGFEGLAGSGRG